MRNAYTGNVQGYGDSSYQQLGNNPLGYDFWAKQAKQQRETGAIDYGALRKQINDLASQYTSQMQTMYGGPNNQFQAPDIGKLGEQLVMQAPPDMRASNGPLDVWYQYAKSRGLVSDPFSHYVDRGLAARGTATRSFR